MHIAIVPADRINEAGALTEMDRQIFSETDAFDSETWKDYESYWILVDNRRAGSIALQPNITITRRGKDKPATGCLFIGSTGLLPEFRGQGVGDFAKRWEVEYAKSNGFRRVVTTCRLSNTAIISLNTKWGFTITREIPGFYSDPTESAVVLERIVN